MHRLFCLLACAGALAAAGPDFDSLDTGDCLPPCRPDFVCLNGRCVSRCNPPCPSGQECTPEGVCVLEPQNRQPVDDCPAAMVVLPDLRQVLDTTAFSGEDLRNASHRLGKAVADAFGTTQLVPPEDLPRYEHCDTKTIVVTVSSYHTEPATLGQREGVLVFEVAPQPTPTTPTTGVHAFTAHGRRHWGDSVPLAHAVEEAVKLIRRHLRRR